MLGENLFSVFPENNKLLLHCCRSSTHGRIWKCVQWKFRDLHEGDRCCGYRSRNSRV